MRFFVLFASKGLKIKKFPAPPNHHGGAGGGLDPVVVVGANPHYAASVLIRSQNVNRIAVYCVPFELHRTHGLDICLSGTPPPGDAPPGQPHAGSPSERLGHIEPPVPLGAPPSMPPIVPRCRRTGACPSNLQTKALAMRPTTRDSQSSIGEPRRVGGEPFAHLVGDRSQIGQTKIWPHVHPEAASHCARPPRRAPIRRRARAHRMPAGGRCAGRRVMPRAASSRREAFVGATTALLSGDSGMASRTGNRVREFRFRERSDFMVLDAGRTHTESFHGASGCLRCRPPLRLSTEAG